MKLNWIIRILLALIIGGLGYYLRVDAANKLPVDSDEDTYLNAALHYSISLRRGEWKQIYKYDYNNQHPVLSKLSYAAALLPVSPAEKLQSKDIPYKVPVGQTDGKIWIVAARENAALWGGLAVGLMAWLNPLAGIFLACQTTTIKFTSEVYLEALPFFTSLLMLVCYEQWRKREFAVERAAGNSHWLWLAASSLLLGMTAAGQYIYCVAGLAALLDFGINLGGNKNNLKSRMLGMGFWGAGAIFSFFVFNPILWIYTIPRLSDSILFHINYTHSDNVIGSGRQWWHTLYILFRPTTVDYPWLSGLFYIEPDFWIAVIGMLGLPLLWFKQRIYAIWLMISLVFLLIWATKWEQYALIAIPALCLSAGMFVYQLLKWVWLKLAARTTQQNG
ncbi:MAG: hypothetical protein LWX83_16580 [Anaerolineae bacterium]|nr:hypothetical protein [Anaerolineae bacterium]